MTLSLFASQLTSGDVVYFGASGSQDVVMRVDVLDPHFEGEPGNLRVVWTDGSYSEMTPGMPVDVLSRECTCAATFLGNSWHTEGCPRRRVT